ncbi:hypothetical protein RJ639_019974 [Escallonia herrerae]|uniref:Reverse transcriptase Ty1/copia-type domain-containing protein n=1 Tax=Escallonia herrerae TaxID=1293975 RepID=A0AA89AHN2_9ASTE|nr:hypothetical protein RJ639_019974 [Escallonia herrerae]
MTFNEKSSWDWIGRDKERCVKTFDDFKKEMAKEFEMTDIDLMSYYIGIELKQRYDGIFISQEAYICKRSVEESLCHVGGCLGQRDWRGGGEEGMIESGEVEIGSAAWAGGEDVKGWVGLGEISSGAIGSAKGDCMEEADSCMVVGSVG